MAWETHQLGWLVAELKRFHRGVRPTTLAQEGLHRDPFRILVSCVISLRTKDAVTAQASARLLGRAPNPASLAQLSEEEIAKLIYPAGFFRTKAKHLHQLAHILLTKHGGHVPAEWDALLALPGVGRKTAALVLGLGHGVPAVCVDTHVHRIANRLGLVATKTPEQTERALMTILPEQLWIPINDLLVTFGQHLCTPTSPYCTRCPLASSCPRYGVTRHR